MSVIKDCEAGNSVGLNGDFFRKIVQEMDDGIVAIDTSGTILFCNHSAEQLFQVRKGELAGRSIDIILPDRFRKSHVHHLAAFREGDTNARYMGSRKSHIVGLRADGTEINMGATILRMTGPEGPIFVAVLRDLTERINHQNELERLANTDPLSGLYNRRAFATRAVKALEDCRRTGAPVCLFIFDLDHFKRINDSYGHDVGDRVIREFAEFLKPAFQDGKILGRWGGEEFIALAPDTTAYHATTMAEIIRRNIEVLPFTTSSGYGLRLTTSVGIGCSRDASTSLDNLIKKADMALYSAKTFGRNRVASVVVDDIPSDAVDIQGAA